MQFSAQTLGPIGDDTADAEAGETFIDFMGRKVAEYMSYGVPKDMAELAAEDAWFAADEDGYDSEAGRESYYRSIGYTDAEAHAAAVDEQIGEPVQV
jgi:hypothetical protein